MNRVLSILLWAVLAAIGAFAFAIVALKRGESRQRGVARDRGADRSTSSPTASTACSSPTGCCGSIRRAPTPAVRHNDGLDYVPDQQVGAVTATTSRRSPAPGRWSARCWRRRWATCPARCGSSPASCSPARCRTSSCCSSRSAATAVARRDGARWSWARSPARSRWSACSLIMIIILAVLALVVVKALADSPWGMFTIAATIPIALLMGVYMRYHPPGRVGEASRHRRRAAARRRSGSAARSPSSPTWGPAFTLTGTQLAWTLIVYGFVAASLPVWLMLAPRDYLSHLPEDRHHRRARDRHLVVAADAARCRR